MELSVYQKNYEFQESFWWFVGMRKIYSSILDNVNNQSAVRRVLDVGCGVGNNMNTLGKYGSVLGIDVSNVPLQFCKKKGFNKCVQADATELPFQGGVFSIVAALNIIEHVENDVKLIQELKRVCQKGGTILIVTSAFPFLWGRHDEASHHYRRYTKGLLAQKLSASEVNIESLSYINMFGFHILDIIRPLQKLIYNSREKPEAEIQTIPRFINWFLIMFLSLESIIIKTFNLPYGASLVCLARKK